MLLAQNILDLGGEAAKQGLGPFAPGSTYLANNEGSYFGNYLGGILNAVLVVAILFVLLYLIWGAIEWITSGGDKGKTEKARDKMTQAVVGVIVLASTIVIFGIVQNFLGVNFFNFNGNGGSSGGGGNGGGSSSAGTCNGVAIGSAPISDSGTGNYCKNNGAAMVQCHGADHHLSYAHFDPISCVGGNDKAWNWTSN